MEMSLKLMSAVLIALAAACGPALACKGPTLLFSDNFQTVDPAWNSQFGTLNIGGGKVQMSSDAGNIALVLYQGAFFDSGDACVDITATGVTDPTMVRGGIVFGATDSSNFYIFMLQANGQATIERMQNGGWLTPVPTRAAPGAKAGVAAVNTLRLTWKGTDASAYVNDQLFINFKIQPFTNGMFGFEAEGDVSGYNVSFSNVKITNAP
jgi:hypothetical protein